MVAQLQIVADTLAALHYAHDLTDYDGTPLNVVHRDVSPHNILVTYEGATKLVDFGIAKAADAKTVTESGVFKGKVRFSSPEQIVGTAVDRRSDVFAAGAVLWEVLTRRARCGRASPGHQGAHRARVRSNPEPRGSVTPRVPEKLDAICTKAMAFDPGDRYATANAFREALLEYLRGLGEPEVALGAVLASAFTLERQEMRGTIDAEIRAVREASSDSIRTRRVPVLSVPPLSGDGGSHGTRLAHAQSYKLPPRGKVVVPIALLVCCALAIALCAAFPARPRQAATALAPSVPALAPSALAPSADRPVPLRLSAQPASARFTIDSVCVAANPDEADVPADHAVHAIAARAEGFAPRAARGALRP